MIISPASGRNGIRRRRATRKHPLRRGGRLIPIVEALEERRLLSVSLVQDINPIGSSSSDPQYLTDVNGTLFFAANDGTDGTQLWQSNGTSATMVTSINEAGGGLNPTGLVNVGGGLFFAGNDGANGIQRRFPQPGK